ncbi:SRPBCC family protein [Mycobacterium sp. NPDC050551]|uniref:SRPBCC family protein n=1 Tax=Mycobacterium sp. NPDC050551 TaxID=3155407 RepID=UPI00342623C8
MSALDTAKKQAAEVAGKLADQLPQRTATQSVTISVPLERVRQFWRNPDELSVVLGDVGEVEVTGPDRYRWRLQAGPVKTTWESRLQEDISGVRFAGIDDDRNEIVVTYREAPRDLGTEVTVHAKSPAPGLLTGALAFKVLYRVRALLQTGEVPTIRSNPSARDSAR